MKNPIILTCYLLILSVIIIFSYVKQKPLELQIPEGMIKVKIISIQYPCFEGGTQSCSGCVYETETKERFFSTIILGRVGEAFIVQPATVNYKNLGSLIESNK